MGILSRIVRPFWKRSQKLSRRDDAAKQRLKQELSERLARAKSMEARVSIWTELATYKALSSENTEARSSASEIDEASEQLEVVELGEAIVEEPLSEPEKETDVLVLPTSTIETNELLSETEEPANLNRGVDNDDNDEDDDDDDDEDDEDVDNVDEDVDDDKDDEDDDDKDDEIVIERPSHTEPREDTQHTLGTLLEDHYPNEEKHFFGWRNQNSSDEDSQSDDEEQDAFIASIREKLERSNSPLRPPAPFTGQSEEESDEQPEEQDARWPYLFNAQQQQQQQFEQQLQTRLSERQRAGPRLHVRYANNGSLLLDLVDIGRAIRRQSDSDSDGSKKKTNHVRFA